MLSMEFYRNPIACPGISYIFKQLPLGLKYNKHFLICVKMAIAYALAFIRHHKELSFETKAGKSASIYNPNQRKKKEALSQRGRVRKRGRERKEESVAERKGEKEWEREKGREGGRKRIFPSKP